MKMKTKIKTKTKTKTKMKTKMKNKIKAKAKMKIKLNFRFCFHFVFHFRFCFCFCFLRVFAFLLIPRGLEVPWTVSCLLLGLELPQHFHLGNLHVAVIAAINAQLSLEWPRSAIAPRNMAPSLI